MGSTVWLLVCLWHRLCAWCRCYDAERIWELSCTFLTAVHINSAWNICIVLGMWCIFNTCDECIFHTTEAQWIILPLWHWGHDLYSLYTPLHHLTYSPCLLYLWKLKDRFNVNFTVNLFCLSVSEIFIRAERKVASTYAFKALQYSTQLVL